MARPVIRVLSCCVLASWVYVSGCAGARPRPAPEAPEPAQTATASRGEAVLRGYCAECHRIPDPATKEPREWYGVVLKMQRLARAAGRDTLTRADIFAVTDYLEARAKQQGQSRPRNDEGDAGQVRAP